MSFFFSIVYLVMEYMRPQQMYAFLANLPLAEISIIGMIIFFILENKKVETYNFQNVLVVCFLFWLFVTYVLSINMTLAWQPVIDFAKWVCIYYLLVNIINDREKLYFFVIVFLLMHFKQSQFLTRGLILSGGSTGQTGLYSGAGFFANPGDLGTALSMVFGISYYLIRAETRKLFNRVKMSWVLTAITVSIPIALLATNSRGPALAFVVCLLSIWYKNKKKIFSIVVIILVIGGFIAFMPNWERFRSTGGDEDVTGQQRIELWKAGMKMSSKYPFTGVGPNNFVYVNQKYYGSELPLVQHNVFIQVLSELGYPGLLLYLAIIFGCFRNHKRVRELLRTHEVDDPFLLRLSHGLDVGLIGYMVSAFFVAVLYYPFFWTFLIISVALTHVTEKRCMKNEVVNLSAASIAS